MESRPDVDAERLEFLVDWVLPLLTPYQFALYVLLLRKTDPAGGGEVLMGKRRIAALMGRGTRSSRGNLQHISEKLQELDDLGFIQLGGSDREGTRIFVRPPTDVDVVVSAMAEHDRAKGSEPPSHYTDGMLRRALFERDLWRCTYCGVRVTEANATLDHRVPQSAGGTDTPDNLATCCHTCNSIKSNRTYEQAAPDLLASVARLRRAD